MIFAGDPRYNDPAHKPPVMSAELSALVEKIRAESKTQIRSQAFITAEEVCECVQAFASPSSYITLLNAIARLIRLTIVKTFPGYLNRGFKCYHDENRQFSMKYYSSMKYLCYNAKRHLLVV